MSLLGHPFLEGGAMLSLADWREYPVLSGAAPGVKKRSLTRTLE